ncbi:MAG: hypothetical protein JNK74_07730 [Candidatus Hydrogenedentes bacterium]|nr:hypothetical protein [Candidatus Hydrogenedentota bacterium]
MEKIEINPANTEPPLPRILYCNCTYANVVPKEVKREVLAALSASGLAFDAVPDLCDMAARKDPAIARLSAFPEVRIAACYERAVRWLFHAAGTPLPQAGVEVLNMREDSAENIARALLAPCVGCGNSKQ